MSATLFLAMVAIIAIYFDIYTFCAIVDALLHTILPSGSTTTLRNFVSKVIQEFADTDIASTTDGSDWHLDDTSKLDMVPHKELATVRASATAVKHSQRRLPRRQLRMSGHGRPAIVQAPTGGYNCAVM